MAVIALSHCARIAISAVGILLASSALPRRVAEQPLTTGAAIAVTSVRAALLSSALRLARSFDAKSGLARRPGGTTPATDAAAIVAAQFALTASITDLPSILDVEAA